MKIRVNESLNGTSFRVKIFDSALCARPASANTPKQRSLSRWRWQRQEATRRGRRRRRRRRCWTGRCARCATLPRTTPNPPSTTSKSTRPTPAPTWGAAPTDQSLPVGPSLVLFVVLRQPTKGEGSIWRPSCRTLLTQQTDRPTIHTRTHTHTHTHTHDSTHGLEP